MKLSKKELRYRADALREILADCTLCPHNCRVDRLKGEKGFCRLGGRPKISSASPHYGEESVLTGSRGSGTIFFSGCNLACVYCQNYEISQLQMGREVSTEELANLMKELQDRGCHNINLVTPTPQVPAIVDSLLIAADNGLNIPIVYNSGGYDSVETLRLLEGIVDIYMPDIKYSDDRVAERYSHVKGCWEIVKKAVLEMHRQVGDLEVGGDGIASRGLLVRHLVLPGDLAGSEDVFRFLAEEVSTNTFVNVMDQYRPCYKAKEYPELSRRIGRREYENVLELAGKAGLKNV